MGREERANRAGKEAGAVKANPAPTPRCPDFDLAPLQAFPPKVFASGDEELDGFVLSLSLAFNDLKGTQWILQQMDNCPPGDLQAVAPYNGQWFGMKLQGSRFALAIVHEIVFAIQTAREARVLDRETFRLALEKLSPASLASWERLVALSVESDDPLRKYFIKVRNKMAFHYADSKPLMRGYREFFLAEGQTPHNESALASLGRRMEETRFYYADAAVQTGQQLLDQEGKLLKEAGELLRHVSQGLRGLLEGWLVLRREQVAAGRVT